MAASRALILDFNATRSRGVADRHEGGFLASPVNLTSSNGNRLLMGLAERRTRSSTSPTSLQGTMCSATSAPTNRSAAASRNGLRASDPGTTGQVMQLRVVPAVGVDDTTPPQFLQLPAITPLPTETLTRQLALIEKATPGRTRKTKKIEGLSKRYSAPSATGCGPSACGWMR